MISIIKIIKYKSKKPKKMENNEYDYEFDYDMNANIMFETKEISQNNNIQLKKKSLSKKVKNIYSVDVSEIPSTVCNIHKFMDLHPEFFKTNVSKKMIYLIDNQIYNIYSEPIYFKDSIHKVSGYITTDFDNEKKYYKMILSIYNKKSNIDYIKQIEKYVIHQAKHGNNIELYYYKILNDTMIKHLYYSGSTEQWTSDVKILHDEFFLPNKDYLLSIMKDKIKNNSIGSATSSWNNMILTGAPGVGKCLSYNTPILMFDGSIKKVQDIILGDKIMGDDSTCRNVINLNRGKEMMYEIKQGNDSYTVNKSHILSLVYSNNKCIKIRDERNSYQVKWFDNKTCKLQYKSFTYKLENIDQKRVKYIYSSKEDAYNKAVEFLNSINENKYIDISVENYLQISDSIKYKLKGYKTKVEFDEEEIFLDPYILGIWLGDGTTSKPEITNQDSTILKYLAENVVKYDCFLHKMGGEYTYRINSIKRSGNNNLYVNEESYKNRSNNFLNLLRKYNVLNNKHIPDVYKINSTKNRLKLLAGLIDSDGYLHNNNGYEIYQKNNKLSEDIVFLCKSLGFKTEIYKRTKGCWYKNEYKENIYNFISINGEGLENIPVLCPRKKASKRKQIKNALHDAITITEKQIDNYYGFELDGNHRFILGNFIVTHNSSYVYRVSMTLKLSILSVDLSLYLNKKKELYAMFHGQEFCLPNSDKKEASINNYIIVLEEFDTAIEKLLDIENIFKYKDILKRNYLDLKKKELKEKSMTFATNKNPESKETPESKENLESKEIQNDNKDVKNLTYEDFMEKMMLDDGFDTKNNIVYEKAKMNILNQREHDNELHSINAELNNIIKGMDEDNRSNILRLSDLLELFQGPIPIKNRLIIATTNHFEKIKTSLPALFRSGRMSQIPFEYLDWISLNKMTKYYFDKEMTLEKFEINIATSQIIELAIRYVLTKNDFNDFQKELFDLCN